MTSYDVIVVGGGHAGAEAAHAAARLGARTLLLTMSLDKLGAMSCNPAIGGVGKGQIVREIDALGGLMGRVADQTAVHFRMLNTSKGPAVWSPRCQSDRHEYALALREALEATPGLFFRQDAATDLLTETDARGEHARRWRRHALRRRDPRRAPSSSRRAPSSAARSTSARASAPAGAMARAPPRA